MLQSSLRNYSTTRNLRVLIMHPRTKFQRNQTIRGKVIDDSAIVVLERFTGSNVVRVSFYLGGPMLHQSWRGRSPIIGAFQFCFVLGFRYAALFQNQHLNKGDRVENLGHISDFHPYEN